MVLLPKKESASDDPAQYRPITVLPVLTRVLHEVVELELRAYITANNPFASVQAGFQPGRSTFDHLATIHTLAGMLRTIRKDMVGAFQDVEKAFDKIPHWGLLEVLRDTIKLPVAGVEAVWLLLDSNSTTIFGHEVPITRGCLQGSPLWPLLRRENVAGWASGCTSAPGPMHCDCHRPSLSHTARPAGRCHPAIQPFEDRSRTTSASSSSAIHSFKKKKAARAWPAASQASFESSNHQHITSKPRPIQKGEGPKRNSTRTSRLVTHDTTIRARACLSSQSETG